MSANKIKYSVNKSSAPSQLSTCYAIQTDNGIDTRSLVLSVTSGNRIHETKVNGDIIVKLPHGRPARITYFFLMVSAMWLT